MTTLDDKLAKYVQKAQKASKPSYLILYGKPGSGKSHLAATSVDLPGVKKVLYVDLEGSTEGVLDGFDSDKIDIIRVDELPLDDQFEFVDALIEGFAAEQTNKYQVVIIDTFDVAQSLRTDYAIRVEKKEGWDVWRAVGAWSLRAASILRSFNALSILVIHSKETRSETGAKYSALDLDGQAKEKLPGFPQAVLYLERGSDGEGGFETTVYTQPNKERDTKNRYNWPDEVIGVTLPKLWKLIDNKKEGKK